VGCAHAWSQANSQACTSVARARVSRSHCSSLPGPAPHDAGIENGVELFDEALHRRTGFHVDEQSPIPHAKAVRLPTLVAQVHDDVLTYPSDVQAIYDNIAAVDKKLHWIEGTDQRFRGYNYFGEHPEVAIEWFDTHMKEISAV
jgi:uncharacterized protein